MILEMTGESSAEQPSTQERFTNRLAYWNNYFSSADPDESVRFKSDAISELDLYWSELGYMDEDFIVFGTGSFSIFADQYDEENLEGYTEIIDETDSSDKFPRPFRTFSGPINGRLGTSHGFDIISPSELAHPRLVYIFEADTQTYVVPNKGTNYTSLAMNVDIDGANLVDPATFSIHGHVPEDEPQDANDMTEAELEAEADSIAASGIEITQTLSECSDSFLKFTQAPRFRHRKTAKQVELLRAELDRIEALAPVFGQMAIVEAEHIMINQGSGEETPTFRTIDASEIILQGYCGGLVLPWMHDVYRNGIRNNQHMIYIAGGLCLALLPFSEIYIPGSNEIIPADRNILIPISGQTVEASIFPVR